jgi:two-component system nitrogen regulation sensor histidine kinase NtrY
MQKYLEAQKQDLKRRRRETGTIFALAAIILILTYLATRVFDLGLGLSVSSSILFLVFININVILLLLLLFLIFRNLVKLLFERRKKIMGARLRTKLVFAFVILSLLPTMILFFVSVQFISSSIEYWYRLPIEKSLRTSLDVGKDYYKRITDDLLFFGNHLGRLITYREYTPRAKDDELERLVNDKRLEQHRVVSIKVYSQGLDLRVVSQDNSIDLSPFKDPDVDLLRKCFEEGTDSLNIQSADHGDLVSGIVPVFSRTESKAVVNLVVLSEFVPRAFENRLDAISRGLEEYEQNMILEQPVKIGYLIWLSIVTLLIIFSSVWFGFFLAKGITVPIQELAEGTKRVAAGDYDFFVDLEAEDEIGVLVNSFNRMTLDLKNSKTQLEATYEELLKSNIEIEQRRLYMEIVLANVAAGVISADTSGRILTINKSAERMLDIKAEDMIGKHYKNVIGSEYVKTINKFLRNRSLFRRGFMERQVRLTFENRTLTLLVSLNVLRDDRGKYLGLVAVFEDLSEIEKAQRMAAWREVARRIAHEVKNPLTPIQLSAQRLKKKYGHRIAQEDGKVFDECTDLIINQVEELKRLVNEFSNFARMPASNPTPSDINQIITESVGLFKEAQKNTRIVFNDSTEVPMCKVDTEQIKRVMINLLDNAIGAIDGDGVIEIDLSFDREQEMVRIEVADNGRGIPREHKMRLFEPYFSTKKQGSGLGLAIVSTIISDHNGFIRVHDNKPCGTKFVIELPLRA